MPAIPFATQSYKLPQLPISAQRCINMYCQREPKDAKQPTPLLSPPGLTNFVTVGAGPIRGMRFASLIPGQPETLYVVSGVNLYKVAPNLVVTNLGGSIPGSNIVSMSDNGIAGGQLIIVNGTTHGFIWSQSTGFISILDPNFLGANIVTFFDNYFVLNNPNTNQFFLSNLNDGTTYPATNLAAASAQPGNLVGIVNQNNSLLLFGETHIEPWYDAGAANFPFQRYTGATIERGCIGNFSQVKEDNSVFFLGDDLIYYRLDGSQPKRVSQHAIEAEWTTYFSVNDINSFSYTFDGHKFVVLTFPSIPRTWVLDLSTNLWHERISWDQFNNTLGRWRVNCHIKAYGRDLFGDFYNGNIGVLNPNVNTEYGNTIQAQVVSPPLHEDRVRLFHNRLEVDIEAGVGAVTGQGTFPQIMMDYSDDGGRVYINQQYPAGLGAIGANLTRAFWTRLGQARQRVYRLTITDPVRRTILSAHANIQRGLN